MRIQGFDERRRQIFDDYERLLARPNEPEERSNGVVQRWRHPVLTAAHTPPFWRYDFDPATNPLLLERIAVNAVFNPGAILLDGKYCLMARVEGADRKSFFAVAESESGVDGFRFRDRPVVMPETDDPDVNAATCARGRGRLVYGRSAPERKD
jgi:4-O-beta-D-mannosyl-D-glucose phosphorylase